MIADTIKSNVQIPIRTISPIKIASEIALSGKKLPCSIKEVKLLPN